MPPRKLSRIDFLASEAHHDKLIRRAVQKTTSFNTHLGTLVNYCDFRYQQSSTLYDNVRMLPRNSIDIQYPQSFFINNEIAEDDDPFLLRIEMFQTKCLPYIYQLLRFPIQIHIAQSGFDPVQWQHAAPVLGANITITPMGFNPPLPPAVATPHPLSAPPHQGYYSKAAGHAGLEYTLAEDIITYAHEYLNDNPTSVIHRHSTPYYLTQIDFGLMVEHVIKPNGANPIGYPVSVAGTPRWYNLFKDFTIVDRPTGQPIQTTSYLYEHTRNIARTIVNDFTPAGGVQVNISTVNPYYYIAVLTFVAKYAYEHLEKVNDAKKREAYIFSKPYVVYTAPQPQQVDDSFSGMIFGYMMYVKYMLENSGALPPIIQDSIIHTYALTTAISITTAAANIAPNSNEYFFSLAVYAMSIPFSHTAPGIAPIPPPLADFMTGDLVVIKSHVIASIVPQQINHTTIEGFVINILSVLEQPPPAMSPDLISQGIVDIPIQSTDSIKYDFLKSYIAKTIMFLTTHDIIYPSFLNTYARDLVINERQPFLQTPKHKHISQRLPLGYLLTILWGFADMRIEHDPATNAAPPAAVCNFITDYLNMCNKRKLSVENIAINGILGLPRPWFKLENVPCINYINPNPDYLNIHTGAEAAALAVIKTALPGAAAGIHLQIRDRVKENRPYDPTNPNTAAFNAGMNAYSQYTQTAAAGTPPHPAAQEDYSTQPIMIKSYEYDSTAVPPQQVPWEEVFNSVPSVNVNPSVGGPPIPSKFLFLIADAAVDTVGAICRYTLQINPLGNTHIYCYFSAHTLADSGKGQITNTGEGMNEFTTGNIHNYKHVVKCTADREIFPCDNVLMINANVKTRFVKTGGNEMSNKVHQEWEFKGDPKINAIHEFVGDPSQNNAPTVGPLVSAQITTDTFAAYYIAQRKRFGDHCQIWECVHMARTLRENNFVEWLIVNGPIPPGWKVQRGFTNRQGKWPNTTPYLSTFNAAGPLNPIPNNWPPRLAPPTGANGIGRLMHENVRIHTGGGAGGPELLTEEQIKKSTFYITGDWPAFYYALFQKVNAIIKVPGAHEVIVAICNY